MKPLLFGVLLVSVSASALPLKDIKHQFSLDVPAGYVRLDEATIKGALHVYRREPIVDGAWGLLTLVPLGGTISQRPAIRSVVEKSARDAAAQTGTTVSGFEYRTVTWKGFPLEVMLMRADSTPSGPALAFSAQIPLANGAIQVMLAGAPVDEAKLANEFDAVIASFEGETNWGMTINDAEKLGERVGFVVGALAGPFCCLIVAGAVAFALFRKRPAKK